MFASLALMAALEMVPAQGALKIDEIQASYGLLGPKRESPQVLPGDVYVLEWVLKGLKADDEGKTLYTMAVQIKDSAGKVIFGQTPKKQEHVLSLGGDRVNAFFTTTVGTDTAPGKYTIEVKIEDVRSKAKDSFTRTFEVLKEGFGLVRTALSFDANGAVPASSVCMVGQTLQINTRATAFAKDKEGNPNLKATMRILSGGKEVVKPYTGTVNRQFDNSVPFIPLSFVLNLNREGTFTVELKVEDVLGKKTATEKFEITVVGRK